MTQIHFLEGERITLRPIETDDAAFLQRATNEPELREGLGFSRPSNQAQAEEHVENGVQEDDSVDLLVCLDEERIGGVRINRLQDTRPYLSYWIVPEHHGEGYATEAVSLLLEYFFETFDKVGIRAFVFDFNEASAGLLEKLGFQREGRHRKDRFKQGRYVDTIHFGLLREEWVA